MLNDKQWEFISDILTAEKVSGKQGVVQSKTNWSELFTELLRRAWLPINQAPKDEGVPCLGKTDDKVFIMQWGGFQDGEGNVIPCWADEKHEFDVHPDWYMPLPPTPNDAEG